MMLIESNPFGMIWRTLIVVFVAVMMISQADAQDDSSTDPLAEAERQSVAVTVYNQGSALVRDVRIFDLAQGTSTVDFRDVAAQIDATSVNFQSMTDPDGTRVLEQNYIYDLVGIEALIERYIDETLSVTTMDGTIYTGQLLSGAGGNIILQLEDGSVVVLSIATARDVRFPNLPDGLITRPTLRWLVNTAEAGPQEVELTYLTYGMSWTADYNIVLGDASDSLDLTGWVTVNNTSGTRFEDAQLKLVAGDVNRIQPQAVRRDEFYAEDDVALSDAAPEPVAQRELFEYQLYEINRPVTLNDNETKQVEFVAGADVPANRYFVYDSLPRYYNYFVSDRDAWRTGITDVQTYLEFTTDEEGGLGADLPAGRVRVYQRDIDGAALLIGENTISHTPQGETIELFLGNAFDLVGERTQTDFTAVSQNRIEESFEIRLRNRKDTEAVEIRVPERLFRWSNWEIVDASADYTQVDSNTIEFRATVEPGEERVITYTVVYTWPNE